MNLLLFKIFEKYLNTFSNPYYLRFGKREKLEQVLNTKVAKKVLINKVRCIINGIHKAQINKPYFSEGKVIRKNLAANNQNYLHKARGK